MRGFTGLPVFGRTGVTWVLAASALWLSACGRAREPGTTAPSSAGVRQLTLQVPGMVDRQGIT
jgi:hypothetical protein